MGIRAALRGAMGIVRYPLPKMGLRGADIMEVRLPGATDDSTASHRTVL